MQKILEKSATIFIGVLIGLAASGILWLTASPPRGQAVILRPAPTPVPLVVQVSGAVLRPGVYALPQGSRVRDAIDAAGGLLADANTEKVNLADLLNDGQKLVIPGASGISSEGSEFVPVDNELTATQSPDSLIDINYATAEELETLPGIGPTLAMRIVQYRDEHGPFQAIEDIMNVSGIGPSLFGRIKDYIYVSE
ncbi:MAG: helix-hairpin-helix domain-containing protein [Candidatus Villigracilaceae bacterium]